MPKITQLPGQREGLTSAHRCLIVAIQDLCIDVSLSSPTHMAEFHYAGHTHEISVRVVPRYNLGAGRSYAAEWRESLYLPGLDNRSPLDTSHAIEELAALLERLQAYLPSSTTPGGAA